MTFSQRPGLCSLALGALHALLFWLSFPPVFAWPLAFVSLWPLLYVAWKTPKPARSALMVMLAAMPMWLALHWWLRGVTGPGLAVLVVYLSLYAFLFVWIAARWRMRVGEGWKFWAALPVLWIGLEMLRGAVVWHGYPWYLLGHPTIGVTSWVAPALGAYGVSFLVALLSDYAFWMAFASAGPRRIRVTLLLGGALAVAALPIAATWFFISISGLPAPDLYNGIRVAVIQTNVPQDNRTGWSLDQKLTDFARFEAMTRKAAALEPRPQLIAWPETMFPGLSLNDEAVNAEREAGLVYPGGIPSTFFRDRLVAMQDELGVLMVVGAIARDGLRFQQDDDGRTSVESDAVYNSAFMIQDGAVSQRRFDKIHLTPFGEYMPYISWNDWLEKKLLALGAAGMSFDLDAGLSPTILEIEEPEESMMMPITIATPICFEATMPAVCRQLGEADMFLNLTNDGWFGDSINGRENHLLAARWRCAELYRPMVRAANTGISSFIDARGRVVARGPVNEEAIVCENVYFRLTSTTYALIGDLVGWLCLAASGVLFLGAVTRRRTGPDAGRTVEGSPEGPTNEKPADRAEGAAAS